MDSLTTLTFSVVILTALGNGAPNFYYQTGTIKAASKRLTRLAYPKKSR
jgi:hypothetical protein